MPSVGLCLSIFGATCLCGSIHPLMVCWMWPLVRHTSVVLVCLMHTLSLLHAMLLCLPCLLCVTCLAFFASLHFCTLAYMFMHEFVSSMLQSHGIIDTQSKPTFVLLEHPLCLIICLFAPVWHLFLACLLACFPSICFFACLLTCFFCHCMYTHGAQTLGVRVRPLRHKQKGQGCKPLKGNVQ